MSRHTPVLSLRAAAAAGIALVATTIPWASEPPDLELNATTGYVESVDTDPGQGDRLRHVEDTGQGGVRVATVVSVGEARDPRIAIAASGDSWVVWWDALGATDVVKWSVRDVVSGSWRSEKVLSASGSDARRPEIVHGPSAAWVAYESTGAGAVEIIAVSITDSPEPIGAHATVATTTFTGDVDLGVHTDSTNVWATWIDSDTTVGWSVYDPAAGTWTVPAYESYGASSVEDARAVIAGLVASGSW